jgi:uncharacterized repeat protein (TIGR03803 family)
VNLKENFSMRRTRSSIKIAAVLAVICAPLAITPRVAAQTETVLHSFKTKEGASPLLGLIFDSSGNLYGVAGDEGSFRSGSVFELSQSGSSWTEKTLRAFNGTTDGSTPAGGLVFDSSGNLYGTTKLGGSNGVGVVFELTKSGSGTWTETVLHNFGGSKDGQYPTGSLIFDAQGNLYGTTEGGGSHGNGTENTGGIAFKLAPKSGGGFTESVIFNFGASGDGVSPRANLVLDSSGNLYGTTFQGGSKGFGTAFELSPKSGGGWTEKILHNFNFDGTDGISPTAGLIFDKAGNLYGTTSSGGGDIDSRGTGGGTAFELSPQSGGTWKETLIFSFFQGFVGPRFPFGGLVFDATGNLYGTTLQGTGPGTCSSGCNGFTGTVFELTPAGGSWNETTLYNFDSTHGSEPAAGALILDSSGNIYGAAQAGGANEEGVVFKITP